jgi:bis(5'-adenosyl)-triphosphatase
MECPFCVKSVLDAVFSESKNFIAVYNLAPILPGHSLIVPKKHIESLLELTDEEINEMMIFSRKVTLLLLEAFHAEGFNWSVQENEVAGQSVLHLHMHIVPRIKGDMKSRGDWYPKIEDNERLILDSRKRKKLNKDEMNQIITKLREVFHYKG